MNTPFDISVKMGVKWAALRKKLGTEGAREVLDSIGREVARKLALRFNRISKTRHKTALRLGAKPTGILRFGESYPYVSSGGAEIKAKRRGASSVVVDIIGIPFLSRAFGPVTVTPKRAHALTIPIHSQSYAKTADEMESEGWTLFTIGRRKNRVWGYTMKSGSGILFGKRGRKGAIPLFRLARRAVLPKDPRLLPSSEMVANWAAHALERSVAS